MPARIDETDRALAAALVDAPAATFAELAGRLGIAASTLAARYRRLRRDGLVRVIARPMVGAASGPERLLRIPLAADAPAAQATAPATGSVLWSRVSADQGELITLVTGDGDPWPSVPAADGAPISDAGVRAAVLHRWGAGSADPAAITGRLDAVDELLIGALTVDGRADLRTLASAAGIDPSTASRRRRRLIDSGVVRLEALVDQRLQHGAFETMLWLQVAPGKIVAVGDVLHAAPETDFVAALSGPAVLAARIHSGPGLGAVDFVDRVCGPLGVTGVELTPLRG